VNRLSQLIESFLHSIFQNQAEKDLQITQWIIDHEVPLLITRAIMRVGVGYLS
jgi:hypothetical protein